jgi:hypothetical protein
VKKIQEIRAGDSGEKIFVTAGEPDDLVRKDRADDENAIVFKDALVDLDGNGHGEQSVGERFDFLGGNYSDGEFITETGNNGGDIRTDTRDRTGIEDWIGTTLKAAKIWREAEDPTARPTGADDLGMGDDDDYVSPSERPPFDKEQVNYAYASDPAKTCGLCANFVRPASCQVVLGMIVKTDTCDRFEPRGESR